MDFALRLVSLLLPVEVGTNVVIVYFSNNKTQYSVKST